MTSEPPRDDGPVSTGRLDVPTLRTVGRRAVSHPLVASWRFRPSSAAPRNLEVEIDATAYPSGGDSVRLDVHWFTTGDYYFHYVENRETGAYQCRWDRHPKTDAPRTHFHPPPDAGTVEGSPLDGHHLAVLLTVLDWISERVERLHDDAE